MLCVKCGHQAALLSGSHSDAAMETINKLTRYCWRKICNNFYSLSPLKLGSGGGGGKFLSKCKITLLGLSQQFPFINLLFIYHISVYSFIIYYYIISYLMISLSLTHHGTVTRFLTPYDKETS